MQPTTGFADRYLNFIGYASIALGVIFGCACVPVTLVGFTMVAIGRGGDVPGSFILKLLFGGGALFGVSVVWALYRIWLRKRGLGL